MSASYSATVVWGLLVLAAFGGWGGAIAAVLPGRRAADFGLGAAWGMSFALFAGGLACLLGLASYGLVYAFVAAGVLLALVHAVRHGRRPDVASWLAYGREHPGSSLLLLLCIAVAVLQYLVSIGDGRFNPNDDYIAYFPFAKQILQQGTLFDPFSTRRVMSYGGQSLLHAIVLAGTPGYRLHVFDGGICVLMVLLLILGERRKGQPLWPALLALLLLVTLPEVRANTYPQMSGVVVFYALYRTLAWLDEAETAHPISSAALVSLVATAACTLRSNYIAVAIPMVALSYAVRTWKSRDLRQPLYAAAFGILFLLPWMAMSQQSSGTPLFPLIRGHFNAAFPMMQDAGGWRHKLAQFAATVTENRTLRAFPLLLLAGLLMRDRGSRKPLHAFLLAGVAGWVMLVLTLDSDAPSFERYVYGFLAAIALAVTMRCTLDVPRLAKAAVIVAIAAQLARVGLNEIEETHFRLRFLPAIARMPIDEPEDGPLGAKYRALQTRVPAGQRMLVMVDHPFLFDFSRNPIYNVDTAAAVSPPPGFPYYRGPEAVAAYLRGQQIRYFAYVRPQRALSLFNRSVWERQARAPHFLWRAQAPVYLDVFDNVAALSMSRRHLYEDDLLVLLDLNQSSTEPRPTSAAASRPPA